MMGTHRERKITRLPNYDYSLPGAYFVTACTKDREFLFETPQTKLAVTSAWHSVLDIFDNVELDAFIVMPNHIHGIIWILGEGAYRLHPGTWKNDILCRDNQIVIPTKNAKYETLNNIVGAFKTTAATRINKLRGAIGCPVWQKSFYDRIIRGERELDQIRKYIVNNPFKWEQDRDNLTSAKFYPSAKSADDYWNETFA